MARMKEIIKIKTLQPMHEMKFYRGERLGPEGSLVDVKVVVGILYSDGTTIIIGDLEHHVCHSPTGFGWGYEGSGPADLARSILWDYFSDEPTSSLYQVFKSKFVAGWQRKWEITEKQIAEWLIEVDEKDK